MSTAQNIPLTFRMSPLPDVDMTPQEFADAMVARLTAESTNTISFFAAGSVAPTSNVGPWLKDNNTWYVWSDSLGAYAPQTINSAALGYIAQQAPGPDHTTYTFWILLDGAGKAQSIQYYSGGAWKDVYEDTFANIPTIASMNAAIAAAVGGATVNTYPARADGTPFNQTIPIDGANHQLLLTSDIDPSSVFNNTTDAYVAPVAGIYRLSAWAQVDNSTGVSADLQIFLRVMVNGTERTGIVATLENGNADRWWPSFSDLIQIGANDSVTLWAMAEDGVNAGNIIFATQVLAMELVKSL